MEDFTTFSLWMFVVAGVLAFVLCFVRYQLLRRMLPVQILICVLFFYKIGDHQSDVNLSIPGTPAVGSVLLAMIFFLGMPILGGLVGFRTQPTRDRQH